MLRLPRLVERANTLLPGLYAWATTVASPAAQRGSSGWARASAACALLALLGAPLFGHERPALGRALGIHAFIGLSVLSWGLLGESQALSRLDPLQAALGSIGFLLYAWGWGALRPRGSIPEDDPHVLGGPPLAARESPPRLAPLILAAAVAFGVACMLLAFRVTRSEHALFAHAAAVLAAIALVGSGTRVALERGRKRPPGPARERLNSAAPLLAVLGALLVIGLLWTLSR